MIEEKSSELEFSSLGLEVLTKFKSICFHAHLRNGVTILLNYRMLVGVPFKKKKMMMMMMSTPLLSHLGPMAPPKVSKWQSTW